jgi:virulence factor Mce-like protein
VRTQIPGSRLLAVIASAIFALALFLYLNTTFGGPTVNVSGAKRYQLHATVPDSQNLVKKSLVVNRGVQIGEVDDVAVRSGVVHVTFTIFEKYRPVPAGTVAQIGHRTVFGEPIITLRPHGIGGRTLPSGATVRSIPTVMPDDALAVFDPSTRRALNRGTRELARGFRSRNAGARLNATIARLDRTIAGVRAMTTALHGQQDDIATLVRSSAVTLDAVGAREDQVRRLVGSARIVADSLAGEREALGTSIDELDRTLGVADRVLPRMVPLMAAAAPAALHVAATARQLFPALSELRPSVRSARRAVRLLQPTSRTSAPLLRRTRRLETGLLPLARALVPATRNLAPLVGYLRSQWRGWMGFVANIADTVSHGDSDGPWLHGFLLLTPGGVSGTAGGCKDIDGLCVNPYPPPDDALDPQPYKPGSYPKLLPGKP